MGTVEGADWWIDGRTWHEIVRVDTGPGCQSVLLTDDAGNTLDLVIRRVYL